LAACSSQAVAALGNELMRRVLIYEHEFYGVRGWEWHDMPIMFILAVAVGLCNAGFTRTLKSVYALRKKVQRETERGWRRWRYVRIWDVTLYAMFCGLIMVVVPMLAACTTPPADAYDGGELAYVQYNCEAGEYNQIATLLLSGVEGAVKHLFSRSAEHFDVVPLIISLLVFLLLQLLILLPLLVPKILLLRARNAAQCTAKLQSTQSAISVQIESRKLLRGLGAIHSLQRCECCELGSVNSSVGVLVQRLQNPGHPILGHRKGSRKDDKKANAGLGHGVHCEYLPPPPRHRRPRLLPAPW